MEDLQSVIDRSREEFVEHYKTKYFGTLHLPIWMAIELISFGALSRLIRGLKQQDLKVLCSPFDVPAAIFPSWVHSLSYVRNICAHPGRLWNRELAVRPRIPKKTNRWHTPFEIPNNRIMGVSSVIYHMLTGFSSSVSSFKTDLQELLNKQDPAHIKRMGFPENWLEHRIWNSQNTRHNVVSCSLSTMPRNCLFQRKPGTRVISLTEVGLK